MGTTSRRGFLASSIGVIAATSALGSARGRAPAARTAPRSGLEPPVVGSGDHTYIANNDWARLPASHALGNTHGVAQDSQGFIYIKHTVHASSTSPDAICVFDPDGQFVRSFGAAHRGGAHGLTLVKEPDGEFLYLCDQARGVFEKVTLKGEVVWSRACPMDSGGYANAGEYHPTNVAVVPRDAKSPHVGTVYVGDGYGKAWVHQYTSDGEYKRTFGGLGKDPGKLNCPHGMIIDSRSGAPVLLVADRSNNRLQSFSLDGQHQAMHAVGVVKMPCHFDVRGDLLLVPDLLARVTLLDKGNSLVAHLGDDNDFRLRAEPREKFVPGRFIAPHGAMFDRDGSIFVVEWVEVGRVTKLTRA